MIIIIIIIIMIITVIIITGSAPYHVKTGRFHYWRTDEGPLSALISPRLLVSGEQGEPPEGVDAGLRVSEKYTTASRYIYIYI